MKDWERECAIFHGAEQVYAFGRGAGKVAMALAMSKQCPRWMVAVKDLETLDSLVSAGVKPSQIIVTNEFRNTSRFDASCL